MKLCGLSGFVPSAGTADEAVFRLGLIGIPRDLIEVAVSEAAAERFYAGRARQERSRAVGGAAMGALIGLLVGIAISLVTVLLPGWDLSPWISVAQLLGPNAATVVGALVGAAVGSSIPPPSSPLMKRALERDEILIVVRQCIPELADRVREVLEDCGASEVRIAR